MGCIYSHDGECEFYDNDDIYNKPNGCDDGGLCIADDDPTPADSCDMYESDSMCTFCYADFNADEECTCGDE